MMMTCSLSAEWLVVAVRVSVGLTVALSVGLGSPAAGVPGIETSDALDAEPKNRSPYEMSWWSVDGGGGASSGGGFEVVGAIGQPDAGVGHGCGVAFGGGLWAVPVACPEPLFCDGFESGTTDEWSGVAP